MAPYESDALLMRVLGDNLMAATIRLVLGAAVVSAVAAVIVRVL